MQCATLASEWSSAHLAHRGDATGPAFTLLSPTRQLGGALFLIVVAGCIGASCLRAKQLAAWAIPPEKIDLSGSVVLGAGCALYVAGRPLSRL